MIRCVKLAAVGILCGLHAPLARSVSTLPGTYSVPLSFLVPLSGVLQPPDAITFGVAALSAPALEATPEEARFTALVNRERARRRLKPLAWDSSLCLAGRRHSEEMARLGYFDHISPTPGFTTPADRWERVAEQLPDSYTIGENLFYGSVRDVAWGHASLMESRHHRENLLNPAYSWVGVGVHLDRAGGLWVTQMFRS